jgi:hypothetical protein
MDRRELILSETAELEESDKIIREFRLDIIEATKSGLRILYEPDGYPEWMDDRQRDALEDALVATINQFTNGNHPTLQVWLGVASFCYQELQDLRDLLAADEILLKAVCDAILPNWKLLIDFYDTEAKSESVAVH